MKLIFTIKGLSSQMHDGYRYCTGSFALNTIPRGNIYILDKFLDKTQEQRFKKANSPWKAITIKKL